jgi:hypothetical protein
MGRKYTTRKFVVQSEGQGWTRKAPHGTLYRYARNDQQENRRAEQNSSKPHIIFGRNSLAPGRGATYGNDLMSLTVVEGFDRAGTAAQGLVGILFEHLIVI